VALYLSEPGVTPEPLPDKTYRYYTNPRGGVPVSEAETLEAAVVESAKERDTTITLAESCTGGAVSTMLTSVAGSSAIFLGGVVSYSYDLKERLLGVSRETLEREGAVSPACAREMVTGCAERLGGTLQLAITGIAGPGGGTMEKPVGLVYMAMQRDCETTLFEFQFPGDRQGVRYRSVESALLLLLYAMNGKDQEKLLSLLCGRRLTGR